MKVLIIEDETAFRQVLEEEFRGEGGDVTGVGTGKEALQAFEDREFDIVITDLRLPDTDGIEVMKAVREAGIEVPFLLMTAFASVRTAVSALQMGAADYLIKPVRVADVVRRVKQIHELDRLQRENTLLKRMVRQDYSHYWYPDTPVSQQVQQLISKVCDTDLTILIVGETGTGNGMTARLLHSVGPRSDRPFVSVNCGAIPENLVESELFGHAKGAFTSADKATDGLIKAAHGGTLFLDEIGELPLPVQVKFLTFLEEKIVRPVGSVKDIKVDCRIIAATNRNLEDLVAEGKFRRDLYFRLNVFQISLPPLREQKEALPSLMNFTIEKYKQSFDIGEVVVPDEVRDLLYSYSWPGNIREFDNAMERALLLRENKEITVNDLPPAIASAAVGTSGMLSPDSVSGSFKSRVETFERHVIAEAIKAAGGDRRAAAQSLGIGLSTLYRKLES